MPEPRRVAVSEWTLREPHTERALGRIADAGFDSVELGGREVDRAGAVRALRATGLAATSVCPIFGPDRDFASADPAVRASAADLLRRWTDLAGELGARSVIVVPSDRPGAGGLPRGEQLSRSADTIAGVAAECAPGGPVLVIEPLNRYETHLVRTLAEADELRRMVDSPQVAVMGDLFHMNIEEDSITEPLIEHAAHLRHLHLADNQRRAPGTGRLDLGPVFDALDQAAFDGTLALEFLPATDTTLRAARTHLAGIFVRPAGAAAC